MSATELEPPTAPTRSTPRQPSTSSQPSTPAPRPRPELPRPRLRHELRDGFTVAGLSLAASVAVTALLWVGLQWLG